MHSLTHTQDSDFTLNRFWTVLWQDHLEAPKQMQSTVKEDSPWAERS